MNTPTDSQSEEYVAIIDQDEVTDEVRNIAVKYDPVNCPAHGGAGLVSVLGL
jgi:ATP-binding cassette subfamily E protein 1